MEALRIVRGDAIGCGFAGGRWERIEPLVATPRSASAGWRPRSMTSSDGAGRSRRGLLIDFGGVLTSDLFAALEGFCVRHGLPPTAIRDLMADDPAGRALFHDVETGAISQPAFDAGLGRLLGVPADGVTGRMLADLRLNRPMLDALAAARRSGMRVGVLSNSWGTRPYDAYAGADLPSLVDVAVISHEVGVRKPDPAIYRLALGRLGVPAEGCVFVDDVAANLVPARALGMATVRHTETDRTLAELRRLLGVPLTGDAVPASLAGHQNPQDRIDDDLTARDDHQHDDEQDPRHPR